VRWWLLDLGGTSSGEVSGLREPLRSFRGFRVSRAGEDEADSDLRGSRGDSLGEGAAEDDADPRSRGGLEEEEREDDAEAEMVRPCPRFTWARPPMVPRISPSEYTGAVTSTSQEGNMAKASSRGAGSWSLYLAHAENGCSTAVGFPGVFGGSLAIVFFADFGPFFWEEEEGTDSFGGRAGGILSLCVLLRVAVGEGAEGAALKEDDDLQLGAEVSLERRVLYARKRRAEARRSHAAVSHLGDFDFFGSQRRRSRETTISRSDTVKRAIAAGTGRAGNCLAVTCNH